jgi:hypothetical protein
MPPATPSPGLCAECVHSRQISSRRGSEFWLCRKSEQDPRFPKYPTLPVLECAGFEPKQLVEKDRS